MKTYKEIDCVYCAVGYIDPCGSFTCTVAAATYNACGHITNSALRVSATTEKQEVGEGVYTDWYWGNEGAAVVNIDSRL